MKFQVPHPFLTTSEPHSHALTRLTHVHTNTQMHGAEAFRAQVIEEARPWSDWHGDRILAAHADFAADANVFRRLTDRLTGFISDLSIPTDQTFHVHRFANVLAGGKCYVGEWVGGWNDQGGGGGRPEGTLSLHSAASFLPVCPRQAGTCITCSGDAFDICTGGKCWIATVATFFCGGRRKFG